MNLFASLGLSLLVAAGAFCGGWKLASDHYHAEGLKQAVRTIYVAQKQGSVNTQVASQAQASHDRIVYRTQTLIKEVHDAVPPAADVELPNGWVRLHNDAALDLPEISDGPRPTDAEPSGVEASGALATVVDNYGTANTCRAQLMAFQDWYTQQSAAFNK